MLELIKKNIHMNRWKHDASVQITLDDDFIVPDTMDDMEQVITSVGDIQVESARNQGDKVMIKGKLAFWVLYRKEEGGLQTLAGSIPFEEPVNVPELEEKDQIGVTWELEDLSAGMINSRKLSVKAIVTLKVRTEALCDAEAAVDVVSDGSGAAPQVLKRDAEVAAIAVRRKDTYRIKEDISLTASKPSIEQLIWSEMKLRGVTTKPLDGKVHAEGELMIFLIYRGEGENTPLQWMEESVPFSGEVDLPESAEGMIPSISVRLVHKEIEAKPDYDGEMRELELDAVLELDMKLYEEKNVELVSDLYATDREVTPHMGEAAFDRILSKTTGKCRISEKLELESEDTVLQICHYDGAVRVDEIQITEDAITIGGVLDVSLLYMTSDDAEPLKAAAEPVPFEYTAETPGIRADSVYQMNPGLEQLSVAMTGGDSIEVKAALSLDILVLQPIKEPVIESITEAPADMEKLAQMPGIVGYIVQPGDRLWDVAKRFHTTRENVMETNGLADENVQPGDRLILVKEVTGSGALAS